MVMPVKKCKCGRRPDGKCYKCNGRGKKSGLGWGNPDAPGGGVSNPGQIASPGESVLRAFIGHTLNEADEPKSMLRAEAKANSLADAVQRALEKLKASLKRESYGQLKGIEERQVDGSNLHFSGVVPDGRSFMGTATLSWDDSGGMGGIVVTATLELEPADFGPIPASVEKAYEALVKLGEALNQIGATHTHKMYVAGILGERGFIGADEMIDAWKRNDPMIDVQRLEDLFRQFGTTATKARHEYRQELEELGMKWPEIKPHDKLYLTAVKLTKLARVDLKPLL